MVSSRDKSGLVSNVPGGMFRDVRWLSNRQGQFIALSVQQIAFYEDVGKDRPKLLQCLQFIRTNEQERLQSFDLSPLSDEALAFGYTTGKVLITKVAAEPVARNLSSTLELVSDLPKSVAFLKFSPLTETHLAACFEGGRSQDYVFSVYDIKRPKFHIFCVNCNDQVTDSTWFMNDSNLICFGCSRAIKFFDMREGARPVCSVPVSSQVRSISAGSVHSCIACIIDDFACIYDRRHLASPLYRIQISSLRKNDVNGVKIQWNPHSATCLSCFRRNSRVVTELISPSESILEEQNVAEITNLSLSDTYDLQDLYRGSRYPDGVGSMKKSHPYLELSHKFYGIPRVSGFSWHPVNPNRLLVVAPDGGHSAFELRLATINKFVTGDFSSQDYIAHSYDNHLYVRHVNPALGDTDISHVMKFRATRNYGTPTSTTLEAHVRSCKYIIDCCPYAVSEIKWFWKWMRYMTSIVDWKPSIYGTVFPGVMDLMQHSLNSEKEELTTERIFVVDPFLGRIRLYKGKERDRVLRICGWPALGDLSQLDTFIEENFVERGTRSRAVAAALITANSARMKKALNLMLERAWRTDDPNLLEVQTFHEALMHYRGVPEQWNSSSESLRKTVSDPYFKMIITFLDGCCDNISDMQCILSRSDIRLEDRIAFAAIHFSDQYFIKSLRELYKNSDLHQTLYGFLITGVSHQKSTHDLLSQYVDSTGDVQTATIILAVGRCFVKEQSWPLDYSTEEVVNTDLELLAAEDNELYIELDEYMRRSCIIVQDYLDMLNMWGLWMQRARLDCILGCAKDSALVEFKLEQAATQTEICCQFCPQAIVLERSDAPVSASTSSSILVPASQSSASSNSSSTPPSSVREMACSHCLKPLPKCILCRRHIGSYVQMECRELGRLSSWFTWCQKCRHGGHMGHLWHWFNSHSECAASGCLCRCKAEDLDLLKSDLLMKFNSFSEVFLRGNTSSIKDVTLISEVLFRNVYRKNDQRLLFEPLPQN